MRRIIIIGATGSGKTMLARDLADRLAIPATDLDDLHWRPGWRPAPPEDFRALTSQKAAETQWIIAGNYHAVRDLIWPRADTMIWLDYSFPLTFWRLLRRTFRRIHDQDLICNGNTESLRLLFSKESIILWLFKSYWRRKKQYGDIFENRTIPSVENYIRLRTPEETARFIAGLKSSRAAAPAQTEQT